MRVIQTVIPRTVGELRDDSGAAPFPGEIYPASAGVQPAHRWTTLRTARAVAAVAGLAVIGAYVSIALARLSYPGHLEILEENSLVEAHRILAGQQLYPAPSASFVPDGYTPLYFAFSAGLASVLGQSYLPLRLVSLVASLVCFAILGRLVHGETRSRAAGIAAAGLLAATYFAVGTWFDVARVDSLFLALSIAGLYAARRASRTGGAVAAGLLLGAAFCTKQAALVESVAVLAALAAGPRRRLAAVTAAAWTGVVGGSTLTLGLASHGWYVYYVFEQMSQHALSASNASQFWVGELLPTLGIAICAALLGARRMPPVLLAGCTALAVEAFAARAETGSNLNDLLPSYMTVAVLAGLAMGGQPTLSPRVAAGRFAQPARLARFRQWRRSTGRRWIPVVVTGLVIVQIGVLASGFRLSQAFPPSADRIAGQRLVTAARALGGTVAVPAAPEIAVTAGLPPTEDMVAAADVLHASDQSAKTIFTTSLAQAVAAQKFSAIITEFYWDLRGFPVDLPRYYHRCPQMPLDGVLSVPFSANAKALPVSVWLPIGRGPSCAAVVRMLDS
jgi:hypothetical protein